MPRLIVEKTGNAVWISHLDLMRLFQRAFKRAGLRLTHTQGFNPRPSVSIALPLSVGVESRCELLEFDLDGELPPLAEMRKNLNDSLIDGIRVLQIYEGGKKLRDLALLRCSLTLEFDDGVPNEAAAAIEALFQRDELTVNKRTKNGIVEQDIIPMIKELKVSALGEQCIGIECLICCQNPTLNPMQLIAAIENYVPEFLPNHVCYCRKEIYTVNEKVFR